MAMASASSASSAEAAKQPAEPAYHFICDLRIAVQASRNIRRYEFQACLEAPQASSSTAGEDTLAMKEAARKLLDPDATAAEISKATRLLGLPSPESSSSDSDSTSEDEELDAVYKEAHADLYEQSKVKKAVELGVVTEQRIADAIVEAEASGLAETALADVALQTALLSDLPTGAASSTNASASASTREPYVLDMVPGLPPLSVVAGDRTSEAEVFDPLAGRRSSAVTVWRDAVRTSIGIMQARAKALQECALGHRNECALVAVQTEGAQYRFDFVHFLDAKSLRCRVVRLDDRSCLVYSTPSMVKETCLQGTAFEIIHPAIGERMQKVGQ
jgi:hypothetical protein